MNEEIIKEGNEASNCIVKAFENNPIGILEETLNNKKIYYFKSSDIGKALKLTNIAVSIQHFDEDEKVLRKAYDLRGCEQDTTFLSSQGVYRLLYNSKKDIAKKFRKWAGNILDDIIFNESQELQKQLRQNEMILLEKNKIIEEKDIQLNKLTRVIDHKIGEAVYVFESKYENETIYKIGRTKNANKRESELITGNFNGEIIHIVNCINSRLLEKFSHQLLDIFRLSVNREWFKCSLEQIKNVLNYTKFVSEDVINEDISELLKKFKEQIIIKKEEIIIKNPKEKLKEKFNENQILDKNKLLIYKPIDLKNTDAFLNECCIQNEESIILISELKAQWRIYSKNCVDSVWQNILKELKSKFIIIKVNTNANFRCKKECFKGLGLKDNLKEFIFPDNIIQNKDDILNFLNNKCERNVFNDISHIDLYNEYIKYQKSINNTYEWTPLEKEILDNFFDIVFFRSKIGQVQKDVNGILIDNRIYGWKGITLKELKQNYNYKILPNRLNSKKINQNDINNNIIQTFNSQRDAATYLKITPGALNTNMKKHTSIKDPITNNDTYFNYVNSKELL